MFSKLRKVKKPSLIFFFIISLTYVISSFFLFNSLLSLAGVETMLRIIVMLIAVLFFFIYLFTALNKLVQKKKTFYLFSITSILISFIFCFGSYYIDKTIGKLDKLSKDYIEYKTVLITLKDEKIDNKSTLGKIDDEDDIEGYYLANKLIKKKNIKNDVKEYSSYEEMLSDLYSNKIDGIFVSSNYSILFGNEETYQNIVDDVSEVYSYSEEIKNEAISSKSKKLTEPFSMLIIGVDSTGSSLNSSASFNGDTLMLITFNPKTLTATALSIPRDSYVPISCRNNNKAKINTAAYGGTSCVVKTVENFTDVKLDYYVKINFQGVIDLVKALEGIEVEVPYSFCEQDSKRRFGNYTVFVEKGYQTLNGEQALALARNRHYWGGYCDEKYTTEGVRNDFTRGQNQQLVVEAIGKKARQINSVKDFYKIVDVVANNIDTNMNTSDMLSFYQVIKDLLTRIVSADTDFIQIEKLYLQTKNQYIGGRSMEIVQNKSLDVIKKNMNVNLGIKKAEMIKSFKYSITDPYSATLFGKGLYDNVNYDTVPNFKNKTIEDVNTWAESKEYSVKTMIDNNTDFENGLITKQNVPVGGMVSDYSSITVWINEIQ